MVALARFFDWRATPLIVKPILASGYRIRIRVAIVAECEHRRRVIGGAEHHPTGFFGSPAIRNADDQPSMDASSIDDETVLAASNASAHMVQRDTSL
jgi:hypothetical protein